MKTKALLIVLLAASVSFFGFKSFKQDNQAQLSTSYVLILEDIDCLNSTIYSVYGNYYVPSYYGVYLAGTQVSITATNCIQGEDTTDYYFFVCWSDGNTSISRTVTMNSDITLCAVYRNKQGEYWNFID